MSSVVGHNVDLDGIDAMEELALIMAAAAGKELIANAMGRKFLFIVVTIIIPLLTGFYDIIVLYILGNQHDQRKQSLALHFA